MRRVRCSLARTFGDARRVPRGVGLDVVFATTAISWIGLLATVGAEQAPPPTNAFPSFVAQRHQWIDAHGATRRDVARSQCYAPEQCGDRGEVERVGRTDAVEQRAEKA